MSLPPLHIPPDGGSPVFLVRDAYTTLLSAADTGGELSLAEAIVPADSGRPRPYVLPLRSRRHGRHAPGDRPPRCPGPGRPSLRPGRVGEVA